MGAGVIVENNVANGCEAVWKKLPAVGELPVNLNNYNKGFVNCVSLIGAYALIKASIWATKKAIHMSKPKPKVPTAHELQTRYGSHSWALIVDCYQNQQYCVLLAKRGFKLILCGEEDDIRIAKDRVMQQVENVETKIEPIVIEWEKEAKNIEFYKQLDDRLKDHDISLIVMPRLRTKPGVKTDSQTSPVFEHIYLVMRFFGPRLKWRPTSSGIIIPSHHHIDQVREDTNGVIEGVYSGIDAFGRTMQYELKGAIDIVIARGTEENALACLGKQRISY